MRPWVAFLSFLASSFPSGAVLGKEKKENKSGLEAVRCPSLGLGPVKLWALQLSSQNLPEDGDVGVFNEVAESVRKLESGLAFFPQLEGLGVGGCPQCQSSTWQMDPSSKSGHHQGYWVIVWKQSGWWMPHVTGSALFHLTFLYIQLLPFVGVTEWGLWGRQDSSWLPREQLAQCIHHQGW